MSLQPVLCGSQRRSRCDRRQPQSRAALGEIRVIGEQRGPLDASVVWPCLRHPVTSWAPVDPFQLPPCCGWAVSLWGLKPPQKRPRQKVVATRPFPVPLFLPWLLSLCL